MLDRRIVAWGLLAIGAVALLLFATVLPRIHGFEHTCDADFSARRLAGDGWWAIRGPQLGGEPATYDAGNDTTLVVPGCGHNDAGVAVRVRGDQRAFDDEGDHLILSGRGVTGATTPVVVPGWDGTNRTLHVLDGTFEVRSLVPHAFLQGAGLVGVAAGVGLLRASQPRAAKVLPAGAATGVAFAHAGLAADVGLILFLFVAPIMAFVALGALVGTATQWRRNWWFWAGGLAFALAWWVTFTSFLGAYPLSPDA